jgi:hypothetical protein
MRRVLSALLVSVAALSCGETTTNPTNQLNFDRPIDVAFACYGGLRPTNGMPVTVDQEVTVSAQPLAAGEIRSGSHPVSEPVPVPAGQENLTEDVLPGNLYGCGPVRQNPAGVVDPDPSHRDVVGWQAQDSQRMLETSLGSGRFFGTVAEVTYACGSSRGKVVSGSSHFVGLRIHPGPGNELTDGNPDGNRQSFIDLTRYKLQLLRASVEDSRIAVPKLPHLALRVLVDAAIYFHDRGKYKVAALPVQLFLKAVGHTKYQEIPGENFNGDHLMRGSNLEFMYAEKILPFEP